MSSPQNEITHVSDTALMVAACRALEFESGDGFVSDPFAARLAGQRGMALLKAMPRPEMMRFGVAVRSRFIDELLLGALARHPIRTVLSLGCGLDTRPWRLDLPATLRWIEVDFADMLDYKESLMSSETPRCRRERLIADLNDAAQRRAIFAAAGSDRTLMITEGLLMYLPGATVEALAREAGSESPVTHWMADLMTSGFAQAIQMDANSAVRRVQASDFLHGEQILEIVRAHGWTSEVRRSYIHDIGFAMPRIQRLMGDRPAQAPPPEALTDTTGVHLMARAHS